MCHEPKILLLACTLLLGHVTVHAAGNAKKGSDAFVQECGDCHSTVAAKSKKGPSLFGVVGRTAGTAADFAGYSEAMKQAGFAWLPEKIDGYIAQPRKVVPGGKMKYDGLADADARSDIVAYLATLK
jgi:cytochrome c